MPQMCSHFPTTLGALSRSSARPSIESLRVGSTLGEGVDGRPIGSMNLRDRGGMGGCPAVGDQLVAIILLADEVFPALLTAMDRLARRATDGAGNSHGAHTPSSRATQS